MASNDDEFDGAVKSVIKFIAWLSLEFIAMLPIAAVAGIALLAGAPVTGTAIAAVSVWATVSVLLSYGAVKTKL